jgi:hypothetical protein
MSFRAFLTSSVPQTPDSITSHPLEEVGTYKITLEGFHFSRDDKRRMAGPLTIQFNMEDPLQFPGLPGFIANMVWDN